jgi:uncharacterized protein (TIRG00374 family)
LKSRLILTLKLVVVAALFVVIFYSIEWHDSFKRVDAQGEVSATVEGDIVGPWDGDTVQFRIAPDSEVLTLQRTADEQGTSIQVSPGFFTYFKHLDLALFSISALMFVVFAMIINTRWWWLLRMNALDVGFWEAQRYSWIGFFFNNIIPGATGGDVIKAVYIAQRCRGESVRALVSVAVDRVIGLLSLVFIGSIASIMTVTRFPELSYAVWLAALAIVTCAVLLVSPGLRRIVRFDRWVRVLPAKIEKVVRELDQALLYYRTQLKGITLWIFASPLIYSVVFVSFFIMDRALGVGLDIEDYFIICPVVFVLQGIPIAPAGWGIGEFLFGGLIGKFGAASLGGVAGAEGIMRTRGVALSILYRMQVAIWSLLGGLFAVIERRRRPTIVNQEKSASLSGEPRS